MRDRILLSVTEILDDETGIWSGELCDHGIHGVIYDFLKSEKEKGLEAIIGQLDFLKKDVVRIFKEEIKEKP